MGFFSECRKKKILKDGLQIKGKNLIPEKLWHFYYNLSAHK
jgi:hypothetical protein